VIRFIARWPFSLFGAFSALTMLVVGSFNPFGLAQNPVVRDHYSGAVHVLELGIGLRFFPPSPDLMLPLLILPFVGLDLLLARSRRRRSRFVRTAHDHRRWHL